VETTATYDPATQEFVLHSPTISSQKHWIGNAAEHGQMAVVFAKLFVNGNNEGLHGFVVRFRNPDGSLPAGVSVRDCGVKMGLNGVDNGRLMFDHVRIPRENLLNKFGDVTADGRYVSSVSSIHKRFLLTIGELVGGRVGVAGTALTQTLTCLSIAIRYAEQRRQFGPANKPEIPILDYTTHQYILFPLLARTIAYKTAHLYVKDRYADRTPADSEAVTVLAGGIKALATWHAVEAMQKCRELCGGNGFGAMNRIGVFATSHNVAVTYEGENSVLLSQVGKSLLTEFQRNYEKNGGLFGLLTQRFTTAVLDKNPVYKRLVSIDHMLDLGMHMRAFQYRQQKLIVELGRKVRKERKNHRGDAFSAWNACLLDVQDAATAYMDAVVLDRVILSAGGDAPESIRDILSLLGALYALSKIQENMGFYMTHKYFAPAKAEAVRTAMLRICEALRPVAADIVNAIRDERLLFAPIAQKDYITQFAFDKHVEKRDRDPEVVKLIHDSLRSRGKRVEVVE
jgi:acyl-CoA oxidase